jgi:hypothetical protein
LMERADKTKHAYSSIFAGKSSVVAYGAARMSFVRELLRRFREKLERKEKKELCEESEKKGKAACARVEDEGDGGCTRLPAFKSEIQETKLVVDVMTTLIPRKIPTNAEALRCDSDDRSVDGDESWSDFSFASDDTGSDGVEDYDVVGENNPLVEFLEKGLMEEISETCLQRGDLKRAHGGISENDSGGSKQKM